MMDESNLRGLLDLVGPVTPPTPAQVADALLFVGRHARDAADRADLICALGLEAS